MDAPGRPTIKGIFVKSHLKAFERVRGREGLIELHKRFGRPLNYSNTDNVPVADEVALLEHIVELVSDRPLSREERCLEAGRLHFRDFRTTPLWNLLSPLFGLSPKFVFMQSHRIAGYVFNGVIFTPEDTGERSVRITLFNNDYPLEHFKGFFEEWLTVFGLTPHITATSHTKQRYQYDISWD